MKSVASGIKIKSFPKASKGPPCLLQRVGVQEELAVRRPENGFFLECYHGNSPRPPLAERGSGWEGRSQRDDVFIPVCSSLTNFTMSQMIQHYVFTVHHAFQNKLQCIINYYHLLINIFPLNLWLLLSSPCQMCALFLAFHLVNTLPYVAFVSRRMTTHTDVVWQH